MPDNSLFDYKSFGEEQEKHNQEVANLKEEANKLKKKIDSLKKSRVSVEDYEQLISQIQKLISKLEEDKSKLNKHEIIINRDKLDPLNSIKKQLTFINDKNYQNPETLQKYYNNIDPRINTIDSKFYNNGALPFSNENSSFFTLLERVNSELQIQQMKYNDLIGNSKNEVKKAKMTEDSINNNIKLFKDAIKLAESKIQFLENNNAEKEAEFVKQKCNSEFESFSQNMLCNMTISNNDIYQRLNPTLEELTVESTKNMNKLNDKITSLKFRNNINSFGNNIISMFKQNIIITYQNNDLISFILKNVVDIIDEDIIKNDININNK